ncbi:MAG TPA: hypothetical protein VGL13_17110 [Polyangiaceae bacterium]|jgi:hypothetical protein
MKIEEARSIVRKHAGRSDEDGAEGFLGMLRPYQKLREEHFRELMEALRALAPSLQRSSVDRELMADLWELVFLAWLWALAPTSKLRRNSLITAQDQEVLSSWLEEIGLTVSLMLGGEEVPNAPSARKMISARRA